MRLIRIYFLKEWISSFFISLGVFTMTFSIGNLVKLVDLIINKGVRPVDVISLFFMMIPFSLVYTVPISTLIATLLSFSKAAADNEIVTLKASGISCKRISLPFLMLGIIFSLISLIFMDQVLPYTHYKAREIMFNIGRKNPTAYLEPGTTIKSFKNHILIFYGMKKDELKDVRIYVSEENKTLRTIIAEKAKIGEITPNGLVLKLYNGTSDEIDPRQPEKFYKLNFKQYIITLNLGEDKTKVTIDKKPEEFTIQELQENIKEQEANDIEALHLVSEMHKRYAQPFSCLAFIIIGLPLGIRSRRREKSIGYGVGLLIIILYYTIFVASESMILNKKISPLIGHWIPTVTIFVLGLYFYSRMDKVK